MTVHGSKGLQAPIVILADTTKTKNKSLKSELLWDDDIAYFPTSSSSYESNCKQIKESNIDASLDEYRRLLYVALTRAEDRLYVAGYTKQKNIIEDYAYKTVLAKSIIAFSEELRDKSPERYTEYLSTILKEIHQDPLRKRGKDKEPLSLKDSQGIIEKIVEIAINKVS
jgi:ATP-dependent exoDNAse (exonuclease V) beta subunit